MFHITHHFLKNDLLKKQGFLFFFYWQEERKNNFVQQETSKFTELLAMYLGPFILRNMGDEWLLANGPKTGVLFGLSRLTSKPRWAIHMEPVWN